MPLMERTERLAKPRVVRGVSRDRTEAPPRVLLSVTPMDFSSGVATVVLVDSDF